MSVRALFFQCIPGAAGGSAAFLEPGSAAAKTTYASDYTTAASLNSAGRIAINSSGILKTYLLGDYDLVVYDSTGAQLTNFSASGINPQEAEASTLSLNLLANASFEVDTDGDLQPDDWTISEYTGGDVSLDSSDQHHGGKSLKFVSVGTGGGTAQSNNFMECTPVRPVVVSWAMKSTATVRNVMEILWYTAAQASISTTTLYDKDTGNPSTWQPMIAAAVPPSTARYFKIKFTGAHSSDSTSGTVRVDNIEVQLGVGSPSTAMYTATAKDYYFGPTSSASYSGIFAIESAITESTFESVGPTGSGATNIWTDMDDIPVGATALIARVVMAMTTGGTTGSNVHLYNRPVGASDGINDSTKVSTFTYEAVASSDLCIWLASQLVIPLNSARVFELTWNDNVSTANLDMYRIGFKMP